MNAATAAERAAEMAVDCLWEAAALAEMGWWEDAAGRLAEAAQRATDAHDALAAS